MTRSITLEDYHVPRKHAFPEFRAHCHHHTNEFGPICLHLRWSSNDKVVHALFQPKWEVLRDVRLSGRVIQVFLESSFRKWLSRELSKAHCRTYLHQRKKSTVRRTDGTILIRGQSRFSPPRAARPMWALYWVKLATIRISSSLSTRGDRNDLANFPV